MINERTMEVIGKFKDLPDTEEKDEINRKYLADEIGVAEFYSLASAYLHKVTDDDE